MIQGFITSLLPVVSPPFVLSLSMILLFGRGGLITRQLLHIYDSNVYGLKGIAIVLMLPAVRRPFRPLIQPRWEWFLRAAPEPRLTAEPLRTEPDRAARD